MGAHRYYCLSLIVSVLPTVLGLGQLCSFCAVQNLVVEPDYRAVKLSWKYPYPREPPGFRISFCEVSTWNSKLRCRQKYLPLSGAMELKWLRRLQPTPANKYVDLIRIERGQYQAAVYDLRMLTNYSFSVEADFNLYYAHERRPHPAAGDRHGVLASNNPLNVNEFNSKLYNVTVETKGFSGKTTLCLSNATEVIVHTGPFFNGKIAVEDAPDEHCAVYGNHSDPLDTYTLVINHNRCGSKLIQNSRIETMIIVHENKEILTHNSRRFLVVCNFPPETYTLKASVEVPPHLLKRKKPALDTAPRIDADPNHISSVFESNKVNNVMNSRILALQQEHRLVNRSAGPERQSHFDTIMGSVIIVALAATALIVVTLQTTKSKPRQCSAPISSPLPAVQQRNQRASRASAITKEQHNRQHQSKPLPAVSIAVSSAEARAKSYGSNRQQQLAESYA